MLRSSFVSRHQTMKGKPSELQTLIKGVADWLSLLSPPRSALIGRNWGSCDIINIVNQKFIAIRNNGTLWDGDR
jgi:hypothetical protein